MWVGGPPLVPGEGGARSRKKLPFHPLSAVCGTSRFTGSLFSNNEMGCAAQICPLGCERQICLIGGCEVVSVLPHQGGRCLCPYHHWQIHLLLPALEMDTLSHLNPELGCSLKSRLTRITGIFARWYIGASHSGQQHTEMRVCFLWHLPPVPRVVLLCSKDPQRVPGQSSHTPLSCTRSSNGGSIFIGADQLELGTGV